MRLPLPLLPGAFLAALTGAAGSADASETVNSAAAAPASAVFVGRWGERRPFHQEVFSIAAGSQIEAARRGSATGRMADEPVVREVLRSIASPVFRLPGGDRLNDFDYFRNAITPAEWRRLADIGGSVPLWGVNATTAAVTQTERLARTLIELGAEARYFELGNELYLERWRSQAPSAREFLAQAAPHAAILRRSFPHAKLGVPGASFWGLVQEPQPGTAFRIRTAETLHPWLKDMLANPTGYDAIVLHLYLTPKEFGPGGLANRAPAELARWAWVRSDGELLRRIFGTVHDLVPDKEIWVTEWAFNATQYIAKSTDPRWPVHQTMLAALYDARFMLNTAYHVPAVTLMTAWTLCGSPAVCLITARGETTIKYDLYRLLRWAREGADGLGRLALDDNPRWSGPSEPAGYAALSTEVVDGFGFFRGRALQSIVILNIQDRAISVDVPELPAAATHAMALTQSALLPGWGGRENPPLDDWNPPRELRPLAVHGGRVTAPPHSITVVSTTPFSTPP